jgi:hypothetical protein
MLDALQQKLDSLLAAGLTDEIRVLYFFVEGRKLLDRKPSYSNADFRMFANWAAHIELAHNRAPHWKLLRAFEQEYVQVIQNGQKWTTTAYENLSVLRSSVLDFLREFSLPDARLQDLQTWRGFALLYLQVVSDCPITLPGLTHLAKVELKAKPGLTVTIMGQNHQGVNWKITPHYGKAFYRQCEP